MGGAGAASGVPGAPRRGEEQHPDKEVGRSGAPSKGTPYVGDHRYTKRNESDEKKTNMIILIKYSNSNILKSITETITDK